MSETKTPKNIHYILNDFDRIFGRTRLYAKPYLISSRELALKVVYEKEHVMTDEDIGDGNWANKSMLAPSNGYKPGDTAQIATIVKMWIKDDGFNDLNPEEKHPEYASRNMKDIESRYNLVLFYDNLILNPHLCPSRKIAKELETAQKEWAGGKTGLFLGSEHVRIGAVLAKKFQTMAANAMERNLSDLNQYVKRYPDIMPEKNFEKYLRLTKETRDLFAAMEFLKKPGI